MGLSVVRAMYGLTEVYGNANIATLWIEAEKSIILIMHLEFSDYHLLTLVQAGD